MRRRSPWIAGAAVAVLVVATVGVVLLVRHAQQDLFTPTFTTVPPGVSSSGLAVVAEASTADLSSGEYPQAPALISFLATHPDLTGPDRTYGFQSGPVSTPDEVSVNVSTNQRSVLLATRVTTGQCVYALVDLKALPGGFVGGVESTTGFWYAESAGTSSSCTAGTTDQGPPGPLSWIGY
jgi:hypothetical protein